MKKSIIAFLVATSFVGSVSAELINSDWKTENDGQVVLNTETGIEWLKLNNTVNLSTEHILSEMNEGGLYDGWRLPTMDEIANLTSSFGMTISDSYKWYSGTRSSDAEGFNAGVNWLNMMGNTDYISEYTGTFWKRWQESIGRVYNEDNGRFYYSGVSRYHNGYSNSYSVDSASNHSGNISERRTNKKSGFFLVSDGGVTISSIDNPLINTNNENAPINVPVSGSLSLLGLAMLGMRLRKKLN